MAGGNLQRMADRVAELLASRLKLRGEDLDDKLRRGGRLLPRRVRLSAEELAVAAAAARNPRMLVRVDQARAARAYDICLRHLQPMGGSARRRAYLLTILTSAGYAVVLTAALVVAVIAWRGLV